MYSSHEACVVTTTDEIVAGFDDCFTCCRRRLVITRNISSHADLVLVVHLLPQSSQCIRAWSYITGDESTQNLKWGTLIQISPQIVSLIRSCPPNHLCGRKMQHFSGEGMDKNTAQNSPKHAITSANFIFMRRGLAPP